MHHKANTAFVMLPS